MQLITMTYDVEPMPVFPRCSTFFTKLDPTTQEDILGRTELNLTLFQ